jgi:hypothetical protein
MERNSPPCSSAYAAAHCKNRSGLSASTNLHKHIHSAAKLRLMQTSFPDYFSDSYSVHSGPYNTPAHTKHTHSSSVLYNSLMSPLYMSLRLIYIHPHLLTNPKTHIKNLGGVIGPVLRCICIGAHQSPQCLIVVVVGGLVPRYWKNRVCKALVLTERPALV